MQRSSGRNPSCLLLKAAIDPRVRLFCFPYAGGSAAVYRGWAEWLPSYVEQYAFELPGHGSRMAETPLASFESVVHGASASMVGLLDKPFVLFGHSFGAIVCFEVARLLERNAQVTAARLIVSGRREPGAGTWQETVSHLDDVALLRAIGALNSTSSELLKHPELMQCVVPALRADCAMAETYVCMEREPLRCPVMAIAGRDDDESSAPYLSGWRRYTVSDFRAYRVVGDHFYVRAPSSDFVAIIGEVLRHAGQLAQ